MTAQNTEGVADVLPVPAEIVRAQIDRVAEDLDIAAVKTGMLATADTVRAVADAIGRLGIRNVVIDPVMASSRIDEGSGKPRKDVSRTLLAPEAVSVMKTLLLPKATVVTPNVAEAEALCGVRVDSMTGARKAATKIAGLGAAAVVIKGGHLQGPLAVDLLLYQGVFTEVSAPRANVPAVHGTGCTFASAIAAGLALGDDVPSAVRRAKHYISGAIEQSFALGKGARLLNHFWTRRA